MNNRIHIIGIAGVATSAIAVMFKNMGWSVSGSDKAFYPPVSLYLKDNGINIQVGFDANHLYDDKGELPDLVIYQGSKGENNPEIIKAHELGLNMITYPEAIQKYIIVPNSIVVAGTYGKTTITSALVDIFENAGKQLSYMFGGVPVKKKLNAKNKIESTEFSIVEGDEYIVSISDKRSKFELYKPKYLILNSIDWEHLDIFKTEQEYIQNFTNLVDRIPEDGLIVANANDKNVVNVVKNAKCKTVTYSVNKLQSSLIHDWELVKNSKPLPCFVRQQKNETNLEIIPYEKKIIGDFNEENFLAAAVMAYELGIKKERIQEAIKNYSGLKRRLEIRFETNNLKIIDDLGSSPPKAKGAIKAIRDDYPNAKLAVVFEPNAGNRVTNSFPLYDDVFSNVDKVFLPRFSKLPTIKNLERFDEMALCDYLKSKTNIELNTDDNKLIDQVYKFTQDNKDNDVIILFLSSHNLRGMVEDLISKFN